MATKEGSIHSLQSLQKDHSVSQGVTPAVKDTSVDSSDANEPLVIAESSEDEGFHISFPGDTDLSAELGVLQSGGGVKPTVPPSPTSPKPGFGRQHSAADDQPTSPGSPLRLRAGMSPTTGRGGGRGRGRGFPPRVDTKAESSTTVGATSQNAHGPGPRRPLLSTPAKPESPSVLDSSRSPGSKYISFATSLPPDRHRGESPIGEPAGSQLSVPGTSVYPTYPIPLPKILPHFETPIQPLVSIPLTSPLPKEFNAVIVSSASCTRFNVFTLSIETKQALKKIAAFAAEVGHVPVRVCELTTGSMCGLKKDGDFYRVNVERLIEEDGEEVVVKLIDYGGYENVTCDNLVTLSEEVATLPSLRRRCTILSLFGEYSFDSAEFLLSLVEDKPVRIKNHGSMSTKGDPSVSFTLCDVTTLDGSSNLSEVIAASQFIVHVKTQLGKPVKGQVTPEAALMGSKTAVQPGPSPKSSPKGQYKIVHYAKKVPFHHPPGNTFEILPTIVNSPQSIWAQVVHGNLGNLHQMQDDLNDLYGKFEERNPTSSAYVPEVGEICAAKFPDDQKYYRVEILCVNHNGTVDVRYLDFGNRETILISQVHNLQPVFLTLPKQALFFSLTDIVPSGSSTWSDAVVAFLREKVMNRKVKVETENGDCTKAYIYDPDSPGELLNDALVKLGHAERVPSKPSPKSPRSPMPGVNIAQQRKHEGIPPQSLEPPFRPFPKQGQSEQTSVKGLRLPLDLSHKEPTLPAQEAMTSGPNLPDVSPLAFKVGSPWGLLGEKPKNDGTQSQGMSTPASGQSRDGRSSFPGATRRRDGHGDSENLSNPPSLVSPEKVGGFPSVSPWAPPFQQPAKDRNLSGSDSENRTFPTTPTSSSFQREFETVKLSEGSKVKALISHVESPLSFYIQVFDTSSLSSLLECSTKFNEMSLVPLAHPKAGDVCICRFSEDGALYRGTVNKLLSGDQASVQFVDYGNTDVAKVADIYEIDEQFLTLPAQAVLCTLNQLLNPSGRGEPWKNDATEFFKAQVSKSETVTVTVAKVLGKKNVVDVHVPMEGGENSVLELMVKSSYGSTFRRKGDDSPRKAGERSPQKPQSGQGGLSNTSSPFAAMQGKRQQGGSHSAKGRNAPPSGVSPFGPTKELGRQESSRPFGGESQVATSGPQRSPFGSTQDHGAEKEIKSPFTAASGGSHAKVQRTNGSGFETADQKREQLAGDRSPVKMEQLKQPRTESLDHWPSVASLSAMKIPSDSEYFEVVVSEIEHPGAIFLQIATLSSQQALSRVTGELNAHFQSNPPVPPSSVQPLAKGAVCCARFSEDEMWYRAEILDVPSEGSYRVRFVDFGNTDTVPLASVAPCPEKFLTTPVVAIRCALNGIGPPPQARQTVPGISRAAEAKAFLMKNFTSKRLLAKVVGTGKCGASGKAKPLLVELMDTSQSEDVDVAEELVKKGLAVRKSLVDSASKPLTGSSSLVTGKPGLGAGIERASKLPSSGSSSSATGHQTGLSAKTLNTPQTTVPQACLPDPSPSQALFKVAVADVSTPSSFWVQVFEQVSLRKLNTLMENLQKAYSDLSGVSAITTLQVGTFCCAKYAADDCWYRVKIVAHVKANTATVCYIDFGNTAEVRTDQLFALDPQFATLPSLAIHCSLAAVQPLPAGSWSREAIQMFSTLVQGDGCSQVILTAKVAQGPASEDQSQPVQLYLFTDEQGLESVAAVMTEKGYAATTACSTTEEESPAGTAVTSTTKCEETLSLPIPLVKLPSSSEFFAMVTHVQSLSEFFLQIANKEEITRLVQLMEQVNSHCSSAQGFSESQPPQVGKLCLAQFTDGNWYRAYIQESNREGKCYNVCFFDFGNSLEVEVSQMRPFSDTFLSVPAQAVAAGLYGVPGQEVTNKSSTILDAFKSLVFDSVLSCKVVCNWPLLVELKVMQSGMSVRDELMQSGLFPRTEDLGLTVLPSNRIPLQGTSTVSVTEAKSPKDFWVQVLDSKAFTELEKITQKMDEYCRVCPPLEELPVLGQLCCAQFSEDLAWYRGRVTAFLPDGAVKVDFVDFGNSEWTTLARLRPFKREFIHVPSQAIHCCLLGFEGIGEIEEVCQLFTSLVVNRQLIAFHRGSAGNGGLQTVIELVDTSGSDDVYIHKALQV